MQTATMEEAIHIAHPVTAIDLFWAELAEYYIADSDFRDSLNGLSEKYRINLFNALFSEEHLHGQMSIKDLAQHILERVGTLRPSHAREYMVKKLHELRKKKFEPKM